MSENKSSKPKVTSIRAMTSIQVGADVKQTFNAGDGSWPVETKDEKGKVTKSQVGGVELELMQNGISVKRFKRDPATNAPILDIYVLVPWPNVQTAGLAE